MLTQQQIAAMSPQELQNYVLALQANLSVPKTGIKVSQKGAISLYGLGRMPVTLYVSQWEKLFSKVEEVKSFIAANRDNPTLSKGKPVTQG